MKMKMFKAKIHITLKPGGFDPQGKAIFSVLQNLGHEMARGVRAGKYFESELATENRRCAKGEVEKICQDLLANPVIKEYSYRISEVTG